MKDINPINIIYFHGHDAGRFIQPYGYDMPTPNLQQLAEEGVLFRNAFSCAPTCSASRAALVTGQYPHTCGMHGLAGRLNGYSLNDYSRHIANYLEKHGYLTALAGIQHEAINPWADPGSMGYTRFLNHDSEYNPGNGRSTLDSAVKFLEEEHSQPFFLSIGFFEPHRDHRGNTDKFYLGEKEAKEPDSRYCRPFPIYHDNPVTRKETANFKVGIGLLDSKLGAVLEVLRRKNLYENTLIICTTDHGPGFPGMKCTLTDWGTGVFLIMKGPCGFSGGKVIEGLVSHLDIFPSICEILGIEVPEELQCCSVLPLINGDMEEIHEMIFSEQGYHENYCPLRAVRTKRYKLIRCFNYGVGEDYYSCDIGPTHKYWLENGWASRKVPEYQLYDLILDPMERFNLTDNPVYEKVFIQMKIYLEDWMLSTNDPLCNGQIPIPPAWQKI